MTTVICWDTDCISNKEGECTLSCIQVGNGECEDYICYTGTKDYKTPYWRAFGGKYVRDGDPEKQYKLRTNGKRVEICGFECFTEQDDRDTDFIITLGRCGVLCTKKHLIERIEEVKKLEPHYLDAESLTEIERDPKAGDSGIRYRIKLQTDSECHEEPGL